MKKETIEQLQKISIPKKFLKDEYICYEGQPGREMYIILKGLVGVNITSTLGTLVEIAQIKDGDFFGEMALFDKLPRSASCIALEDTVCVAINKDNLMAFLANCPEMAEKMLESMSTRIRKLNNDLYKSSQPVTKQETPVFAIPEEYGFSHVVKEPYQDPKFVYESRQKCPICKKQMPVVDFRRNIMNVRNVDKDCRIRYLACEPLWHNVLSCPNCHYSNHYLRFFKINSSEHERIRKLLEEQHLPIVEAVSKQTAFDMVVLKYLQAININRNINQDDNALLGTLWLNLYWLAMDSGDERFTTYCAKCAAEYFRAAIDDNQVFDETSRCSIALSLANLLVYIGEEKAAPKYCEIAMECPDERIREHAFELHEQLA